jgi:formyltetrahydrofolate deformylase
MAQEFLLIFTCQDTFGIIAAVTSFLSEQRAFIRELSEFGDPSTGRFFLRCLFEFPSEEILLENLSQKFAPIASRFKADWKFIASNFKPKTVILVSKFGHCLNDLLYRQQSRRLEMDITGVISNHTDLKEIVENYQIPFIHLPIKSNDKQEQEEKIISFIEEKKIDLIILARYMQILSPSFTDKFRGKIINIHHSFLPSFKGAKPYHQAFERGVKIIGATAHYVTENLDEGPIIEQGVFRVDHMRNPEELVAIGNDVETQVLARAVKYHIENRIFLNGNRTVIFK